MFRSETLTGLDYDFGREDCYGLVRRYYLERHDIWLPNMARPSEFWQDPNLDLYEAYRYLDFDLVHDKALQVSDVLLMPLNTRMNTHSGVVIEGNQFLHHPPLALSRIDPLHPRWARRANIVLRHPEVTRQLKQKKVRVPLHEVVDARVLQHPEVQERVARALASDPGDMRND